MMRLSHGEVRSPTASCELPIFIIHYIKTSADSICDEYDCDDCAFNPTRQFGHLGFLAILILDYDG